MSRPASDRVWRVFYTRPRNEKKVAARLVGAGLEVCLPLRSVLRQWSDREKTVREPLFPSYLFVHVDERERLAVLTDEAIVKTVSFGARLAEVRDAEIDVLRALEAMPGQVEAVARDAFPEGTPVLVTDGPMKGARGTVAGSPRPLYLTLDIPSIRQSVRLQVPADWIMRTEAAPTPG